MTGFGDHFDFTGQRVLVTGAAGGIGSALARAFAAQGASVIAADRNEEGLDRIRDALGAEGRTCVYDQRQRASIETLAAEAGAVDILLNNAGVLLVEPLAELEWEDLSRVMDVNLTGAIALTRQVGAQMIARGRGVVLHTGSQLAGNGARGRAVYAATKAALAQFTRTAALEWGPLGVRVNCLAPGKTATDLTRHIVADPAVRAADLARTPLGRYAEPQDVANAALFLASPAASYITGQMLVVDGGWTLE